MLDALVVRDEELHARPMQPQQPAAVVTRRRALILLRLRLREREGGRRVCLADSERAARAGSHPRALAELQLREHPAHTSVRAFTAAAATITTYTTTAVAAVLQVVFLLLSAAAAGDGTINILRSVAAQAQDAQARDSSDKMPQQIVMQSPVSYE